MDWPVIDKSKWRVWVVVGVLFVASGIAAIVALEHRVDRLAVAEAKALGHNDAAILAAGLQAELDKFSVAPLVLADDTQVHALLTGRGARASDLDRRFEALAAQTKAAAIYLMDAQGLTLAASNWRLPTSFVGSNYRFRRYFTEAMREGSATQFALGTVSREPGLYIAQAVRENGRAIGIVAVKVEFDALEASWRQATPGVFVTDRDGVILLTSNDDWRFETTRPDLLYERNNALDRTQFGTDRLRPFTAALSGDRGAVAARLVEADQPIALPRWRLHLLVDPTERQAAAIARLRFYVLLGAALLAALFIVAVVLRRRRERQAEQLATERTHALREQLGQANRLALLGQITAGVGHEINQPVAAARAYAESGIALLDQGRADEARENLGRIVSIAERIGAITGELRRFARRGSADAGVMPIGRPIDGALLLLHDRIVRTGATVELPGPADRATLVRAEPVRLEQVLVNLLQNALDVVRTGGTIALSIAVDGDFCLLGVEDDGPGLAAIGDRIFQPFATTKEDGLGLGLVISRDIMRDMGGDLVAESGARGARFTMRIPRG